jgi:hypothetical protein
MQKTGGTTLVHRLPRAFRPREIYPNVSDGPVFDAVVSVGNLTNRWRARGHEIRILTGHFPLCVSQLLGERFRTFTVLREPVERTLSYLRHHREVTPSDREKSLEQVYDDRFRGLILNHMVKMLSLRAGEMTDGALTAVDFVPEHLDRAKENLGTFEIVGFQEHFDEFWAALLARYGWELGAPQRTNTTAPVDVHPSLRDRIAEDNALDVELYKHALNARARRQHREREPIS